MSESDSNSNQRLINAYKNMLEHMRVLMDNAQDVKPEVLHALDTAKE